MIMCMVMKCVCDYKYVYDVMCVCVHMCVLLGISLHCGTLDDVLTCG